MPANTSTATPAAFPASAPASQTAPAPRPIPRTMKAIAKVAPGPGLEMIETPVPEIGPHEVLVRTRACSICGTDVHIYRWDPWAQGRIRPPLVVGHEICGEVVRVGAEVQRISIGDSVSADSHVPDLTCAVCRRGEPHLCSNLRILGVDRAGVFSEYVALPEACVWRNAPDLDPAQASIQDPMGNAVYATLVEPVAGQSVVVFGDGPTGLGAVGVAAAAGASTVVHVGKHPARLEIGRRMGATLSLNVAAPGVDVVGAVMDATGGGADVVLEMTGSQLAVEQGFQVLRKGGRFSAFGIPAEPLRIDLANAVVFKGARVLGINGRRLWETWYQMAGLLRSGGLDFSPIITHRIPFDEFQRGFELMTSPDRQAAKVVLLP